MVIRPVCIFMTLVNVMLMDQIWSAYSFSLSLLSCFRVPLDPLITMFCWMRLSSRLMICRSLCIHFPMCKNLFSRWFGIKYKTEHCDWYCEIVCNICSYQRSTTAISVGKAHRYFLPSHKLELHLCNSLFSVHSYSCFLAYSFLRPNCCL